MIGNLVGNYKITDKIGERGVGAVYKGIDLVLERGGNRSSAARVDQPDAGSVREMVWLARIGTRWRITGLKDL
jgi:hypothetical protein